MIILGKPNKIRGIEKSPIYRAAYKAYMNAGQNNTQATAKEYSKIAKYGLNDPTKTKVIMQTAKKDYNHDIVELSNHNFKQITSRKINTVKTLLALKFNSMFRQSNKAIDDALKTQHPDTYKLRKKLLDKGNVTFENNTRPFARLGRLNINPLNL